MFFLVYGFFCVCVLTGVALIIIGLSKPGENSLTRFAERLHKKYFPILVMVIALLMTVSAAAWAGERSSLLSDRELSAIESIAKKAYPQGIQINMVVDEDLLGRFTVIEFFTENDALSLRLEVYPHYVRMSDAESVKIGERVGVKIVESIQKILDESPRLALESILD